jgi:hypothetical protein
MGFKILAPLILYGPRCSAAAEGYSEEDDGDEAPLRALSGSIIRRPLQVSVLRVSTAFPLFNRLSLPTEIRLELGQFSSSPPNIQSTHPNLAVQEQ